MTNILAANIVLLHAAVGVLVGLLIVYLVCMLIRDQREDERDARRGLRPDWMRDLENRMIGKRWRAK